MIGQYAVTSSLFVCVCVCVCVSLVVYFHYTTPNIGVLYIYNNNDNITHPYLMLNPGISTWTLYTGQCIYVPHDSAEKVWTLQSSVWTHRETEKTDFLVWASQLWDDDF